MKTKSYTKDLLIDGSFGSSGCATRVVGLNHIRFSMLNRKKERRKEEQKIGVPTPASASPEPKVMLCLLGLELGLKGRVLISHGPERR